MSRKRDQIRKGARQCLKERSMNFVELKKEFWPPAHKKIEGLTRVYRNNLYTCLVYYKAKDMEGKQAIKVMVKNNLNKEIGWKELQFIKNGIFGKEARGYQYLQEESKLVNSSNMYWFFVRQNGQ